MGLFVKLSNYNYEITIYLNIGTADHCFNQMNRLVIVESSFVSTPCCLSYAIRFLPSCRSNNHNVLIMMVLVACVHNELIFGIG